jgi:2-amino-4-hydroxy-6-hydroxymethyldihydropteridine diphosphokinase
MQSERFLNCLAIAHTKHREPQISSALKRIEIRCGNTRALRTVNIVRMDIDILLFDHQRLHEKDWKRSYIKNLMKEIDSIRERAEQAKVSSSNQQQ